MVPRHDFTAFWAFLLLLLLLLLLHKGRRRRRLVDAPPALFTTLMVQWHWHIVSGPLSHLYTAHGDVSQWRGTRTPSRHRESGNGARVSPPARLRFQIDIQHPLPKDISLIHLCSRNASLCINIKMPQWNTHTHTLSHTHTHTHVYSVEPAEAPVA